MMTLYRHLHTDQPVAVERTRLTLEGAKVERRTLGKPGCLAAIKIDPDAHVDSVLTIGEGFETSLSARQLGQRPTWALGSVNRIKRFPLLPGIEGVAILAENGPASELAVRACAQRWHDAGKDVVIFDPREGSDLNDALQAVGGAS
jgi:hypothetical protein